VEQGTALAEPAIVISEHFVAVIVGKFDILETVVEGHRDPMLSRGEAC
jgi:hypothetical protein